MPTPRIGLVTVTGFCCLVGCAATEKTPTAAPDTGQVARNAWGEPVEVTPPTWCDELEVETLEEYWPEGGLMAQQHVVQDTNGEPTPHGLTTYWWESGQKKLEVPFHCGVKHGRRLAWHRDGMDWSVGEYVNGMEHGVWTQWYPGGTKAQEFTMVYGVWQGAHTRWHQNGRKKMETRYVNGLRQGPLVFWDDVGNVLARIDFVDGVEQPSPAVRP